SSSGFHKSPIWGDRVSMNSLVTGRNGYIGSLVGHLLMVGGHEGVGLDTGLYRDSALYNSRVRTTPRCINKDIRHVTMEDLLGFDAVVHLAELSNDPLGQHSPEITYKINHQGTVQLA